MPKALLRLLINELGQIFNPLPVFFGHHLLKAILAVGTGRYQKVGPGSLKLPYPFPGRVFKETGDVDARHGTLFGAVTGGLIGLLGGPAGVILGAAAGAATGT